MSDEAGEKKHEPGDKKWRDAAARGELPRSADINASAVIVAGAVALVFGHGPLTRSMSRAASTFFDGSGPYLLTIQDAHGMIMVALELIGLAAMVPLAAVLVTSTATSLAQSSLQLAPKALEPKWERLDVFKGIQSTYLSWTPFVELGKGLGKIFVIGLAVGLLLWPRIQILPQATAEDPSQLIRLMLELGWKAVLAALPVMAALAAIDYAASYRRINEQLKRTDRELRDDQKEQEGDPRLKAQRRQRARTIAMSVSLNAVRDADVVVTNPTHVAVALRYRRGEDAAPIVVCKGADHLAARIRREARQCGVPLVENRPLARALNSRCDVGSEVPEALFGPVARVLAVVYQRRRGRR